MFLLLLLSPNDAEFRLEAFYSIIRVSVYLRMEDLVFLHRVPKGLST